MIDIYFRERRPAGATWTASFPVMPATGDIVKYHPTVGPTRSGSWVIRSIEWPVVQLKASYVLAAQTPTAIVDDEHHPYVPET